MIDKNEVRNEVVLKYHVRPKNNIIQYDWKLFETELQENDLLQSFYSDGFHIKIIKASALTDYWISKIKNDPLSLLDQKTKSWVIPKLEQLNRSFQLSDFE